MSRTNEDQRVPRGNYRGKHTASPGFQPMNHWVVCDSCGFDIRAEDIMETWDHKLVCPSDWETRHPQDFVRSRNDQIAAQGPVRPDPAEIFIDLGCNNTSAIAGIAIAGLAIAGNGVCREIQPIPSGTFNTNTL